MYVHHLTRYTPDWIAESEGRTKQGEVGKADYWRLEMFPRASLQEDKCARSRLLVRREEDQCRFL